MPDEKKGELTDTLASQEQFNELKGFVDENTAKIKDAVGGTLQ